MAFGESVAVRPGSKLDPATGDKVQLPGTPHTLTGCVIEPGGGAELSEVERDGQWDTVNVYVTDPPAYPVRRTDVITVRGIDYNVTSAPSLWADPEGDTDIGGTIVRGKMAEG